jgi:hypothetical protein
MAGLLEALKMEGNYKFNIKASKYLTWKNNSRKTLAKYYSQIRELNHKLKFTRRGLLPNLALK